MRINLKRSPCCLYLIVLAGTHNRVLHSRKANRNKMCWKEIFQSFWDYKCSQSMSMHSEIRISALKSSSALFLFLLLQHATEAIQKLSCFETSPVETSRWRNFCVIIAQRMFGQASLWFKSTSFRPYETDSINWKTIMEYPVSHIFLKFSYLCFTQYLTYM